MNQPSISPGRVDGPIEPIHDPEVAGSPGEGAPMDQYGGGSRKAGAWFKVLIAGFALVLAWGVVSLVQTVRLLTVQAPVLVWPLLILVTVFAVFLGRALLREYRAFRQVGRLELEARELADALDRNDGDAFRKILHPRLEALKVHDVELIENFQSAVRDMTSASRVLRTFDNLVLTRLDERAGDVIEKEARNACVAVAILPHPALDAAVVIWRGAGLIRKLAVIYGVDATGLSSLKLFRHVLESAMLAATAETLGQAFLEEGAGSTFARVVKPLGEAAVTYARMRRLGVFSRQVLAPIGRLDAASHS